MPFRLSIILLSLLSIGAVHAQDSNKKSNAAQIEAALNSGVYAMPLVFSDKETQLSKPDGNTKQQKVERGASEELAIVTKEGKDDELLLVEGEVVDVPLSAGSGKDLVSNNKALVTPAALLQKNQDKKKARSLHQKNTTNQSRETLSLDLSNAR